MIPRVLVSGLILGASLAQAADVALDVGHSLRKPGATSATKAKEFDLNQALARAVAVRVDKAGRSVHLVGDDGGMDVLTERTASAREDKLFVSIHHDSIPWSWMHRAEDFHGYSLFISRKNPQLAASLVCAQRIGEALLAAGYRPSRYHALAVEGQNRPYADEARGVHYFDDLVVLKTAVQPAVLVEAGVIVNRDEESRITSEEGRNQLAEAVAKGVVACGD